MPLPYPLPSEGWLQLLIASLDSKGVLNKAVIMRTRLREGSFYEYGFTCDGKLEFKLLLEDNSFTRLMAPKQTLAFLPSFNQELLPLSKLAAKMMMSGTLGAIRL
ncbi:MAG: hypothetical protein LBG19_12515 [Prevotellaceae bacterium]|nr:hypothetical protein [Prevotellaceae bacterium]